MIPFENRLTEDITANGDNGLEPNGGAKQDPRLYTDLPDAVRIHHVPTGGFGLADSEHLPFSLSPQRIQKAMNLEKELRQGLGANTDLGSLAVRVVREIHEGSSSAA